MTEIQTVVRQPSPVAEPNYIQPRDPAAAPLAWLRASRNASVRRLQWTRPGHLRQASQPASFAMAKQASEEAAFARSCVVPSRRLG